jgi:hypothetical protein
VATSPEPPDTPLPDLEVTDLEKHEGYRICGKASIRKFAGDVLSAELGFDSSGTGCLAARRVV